MTESTIKFMNYEQFKQFSGKDVACNSEIDGTACSHCAYDDDTTACWDNPCEAGLYVDTSRPYIKVDLDETVPEMGVDKPEEPITYTKVLTGGSSDYYKVKVSSPTTPDTEPYVAECNDVIEALGLNYAEGNILKALWRRANARQGNGKQGFEDGKYDAEKMVFFANRILTEYSK